MIKKVGLIGAGEISKCHLSSYAAIDGITVSAICDLNLGLAQARAEQYGIEKVYRDYREILQDPETDAVSIVTPTFTHSSIVIDALKAGKHVLCEKPPALTYQDALANEAAARESGKILTYGFVCRFYQPYALLKQYVASGKLGDIYYAEAYRMERCAKIGGWFRDKEKSGGGQMMDAAIHQLDLLLYLMDYPKVKSVRGYTTNVNKDLPDRIRGLGTGYTSASHQQIARTVESFASAYITFEDGKNLFIKAAHIANTLNPGTQFELLGDRGGLCVSNGNIRMLTVDETNHFVEAAPIVDEGEDMYLAEIRHFVDCCNGIAECVSTPHQGSEIIKILNAIYESAESGKEIVF